MDQFDSRSIHSQPRCARIGHSMRGSVEERSCTEDLDVFDPARHRPKPKLPTYTAALAAADTAALAAASAAQLAARLSFACERVAERHSTFAALERSYRALGSDLRDLVKFVESVVSEGRLALRSMRMSSATLEQLQLLPKMLRGKAAERARARSKTNDSLPLLREGWADAQQALERLEGACSQEIDRELHLEHAGALAQAESLLRRCLPPAVGVRDGWSAADLGSPSADEAQPIAELEREVMALCDDLRDEIASGRISLHLPSPAATPARRARAPLVSAPHLRPCPATKRAAIVLQSAARAQAPRAALRRALHAATQVQAAARRRGARVLVAARRAIVAAERRAALAAQAAAMADAAARKLAESAATSLQCLWRGRCVRRRYGLILRMAREARGRRRAGEAAMEAMTAGEAMRAAAMRAGNATQIRNATSPQTCHAASAAPSPTTETNAVTLAGKLAHVDAAVVSDETGPTDKPADKAAKAADKATDKATGKPSDKAAGKRACVPITHGQPRWTRASSSQSARSSSATRRTPRDHGAQHGAVPSADLRRRADQELESAPRTDRRRRAGLVPIWSRSRADLEPIWSRSRADLEPVSIKRESQYPLSTAHATAALQATLVQQQRELAAVRARREALESQCKQRMKLPQPPPPMPPPLSLQEEDRLRRLHEQQDQTRQHLREWQLQRRQQREAQQPTSPTLECSQRPVTRRRPSSAAPTGKPSPTLSSPVGAPASSITSITSSPVGAPASSASAEMAARAILCRRHTIARAPSPVQRAVPACGGTSVARPMPQAVHEAAMRRAQASIAGVWCVAGQPKA